MEIIIKLEDTDAIALLEKVAGENKITAAQYAANIVTGWIAAQLRGKYVSYVKTADVAELKTHLGPIVDAKALEALKEV